MARAPVEEPPPPPPPAQPAPEPEVALEDDPTPDGPACESSDACEAGRQCRGPAGCESEWACGATRACGATTVSYCGCDGATFYAPDGCPGRPYAQVGPCAALGEEIGEEDVDEVEGNTICTSDDDCRAGFVCAGVAGCGTFWTCVRRRTLRCSRDRAPFCACDGDTFFASSSCPGRPIAHAGYCPGDAPESAVAETAPPAPATPEPPAPTEPHTRLGSPTATPPDRSPAAEPAARACTSDRDCPRGQACTGAEGCETEWHCAPRRERCVSDAQYFCGCDGQSFRASMTCPGRPFRHRGSCAP